VKRIAIRTIIAYLLIAAVIFAAVAAIAYLRHNSARARHLRERSRPVRQWQTTDSDEDAAQIDAAQTPEKLR
jgi:large-conductance mechanosensitive channel